MLRARQGPGQIQQPEIQLEGLELFQWPGTVVRRLVWAQQPGEALEGRRLPQWVQQPIQQVLPARPSAHSPTEGGHRPQSRQTASRSHNCQYRMVSVTCWCSMCRRNQMVRCPLRSPSWELPLPQLQVQCLRDRSTKQRLHPIPAPRLGGVNHHHLVQSNRL